MKFCVGVNERTRLLPMLDVIWSDIDSYFLLGQLLGGT
jgi:hypothetical protein